VLVWRARASAGPKTTYLTAAVAKGDLAATVSASGTVRGKDTVSVGAETSGRVKAVTVDFNDHVKEGQVLVEIDPAPTKAALSQARAQLLSARADVKNRDATAVEARLTAERTQAMAKEGLASTQQLEAAVAAADRATSAAEAARAQVVVSEASVESNVTALAKTQVRSPIDGVVLERDVEVGQALLAAMNTPVVFKLAKDLTHMEVTVSIDEADVGRTREGQHASFVVDAWPGKTFSAVLSSVHNVAVTKDNVVTYEGLLQVDNADLLLRPGMTATVTIDTDARHGVLLVSNAALRFTPAQTETHTVLAGPPGQSTTVNDGKHRIYVLREGAPKEVVVEVGLTDGTRTEVRGEGFAAGDLAVVDAVEAQP
jgi:HlyD family secretion protein